MNRRTAADLESRPPVLPVVDHQMAERLPQHQNRLIVRDDSHPPCARPDDGAKPGAGTPICSAGYRGAVVPVVMMEVPGVPAMANLSAYAEVAVTIGSVAVPIISLT